MKRSGVGSSIAVAAIVGALAVPTSSPGAVTLGSDLAQTPDFSESCFPHISCTFANTTLPGRQLASPIDGVVVRWRVRGTNTVAGGMRLKVMRPTGTAFTGVGTGPTQTIGINDVALVTHVFPANQPIAAGDLVALDLDGDTFANNFVVHYSTPPAGTIEQAWTPSLLDGQTRASDTSFANELLFNADVEPDCDLDTLGDETQDSDVSSCTPDTIAPQATITKGPRDKIKTKKKRVRATFEFSSNEPGSTFECSLDGAAFAACTSPHTVKVKKGKHNLAVRARDAAGNVDPTPATDGWKVKRKKRK